MGIARHPQSHYVRRHGLRYLKRTGRYSGLEKSFTQYYARRRLVNAINSKSILSVVTVYLLSECRN